MGKAPVKKIQAVRKFTDREEPRAAFHRIFEDGQKNTDEFNVISYYGIGGFGKTRLIHELSREIDDLNENTKDLNPIPHVIYDFSLGTDKMTVLEKLRNLLKKQGLSFPYSDAVDTAYNIKSGNPIYKTVSEEKLLENPMLGIIADFFPDVSKALSAFKKGKTVLEESSKFYNRIQKRLNLDKSTLNDELKTISRMELNELEDKAAYYFSQDLIRNTEHESDDFRLPVVIFLDTYEQLVNSYSSSDYAGAYDLWLRDDIIKTVPGVLWVIGGREKLHWQQEDDFWDGAIEEHELGDLTKKDAFDFLAAAGIPENLHEDIYAISAGTPLFLDLNVTTYYQLLSSGKEITKESFGNDREQIIERFLRYMSPDDQNIAKLLAILENWSDEEARQIGTKVLPVFYPENYQEFIEHTIIIKDNDQRYYMHQQVRKVIFEAAKKNNPDLVLNTLKARFDSLKAIDISTIPIAEIITVIERMLSVLENGTFDIQTGNPMVQEIENRINHLYSIGLNQQGYAMYLRLYSLLDKSHPQWCNVCYNCCLGAVRNSVFSKAIEFSEQLKHYDDGESQFSLNLRNLKALTSMGMKRYDEAEKQFLDLYRKYEEKGQQYGTGAISILNNLGLLCNRSDRREKAMEYFRQAFDAAEKGLNTSDPLTLKVLNNYGSSMCEVRNYDGAISVLKSVYDMQMHLNGEKSLSTLTALKEYARCEYFLGKSQDAIAHFEKLLELCPEFFRDADYDFLEELALSYSNADQFSKAVDTSIEYLKRMNSAYGRSSPQAFRAADTGAQIFRNQSASYSLKMNKKALDNYIEKNGENYPEAVRIMYNIALDLLYLEDPKQAMEHLQRGYDIMKRNMKDPDSYEGPILYYLGECYFTLRNYPEAVKCFTVFRNNMQKTRGTLSRFDYIAHSALYRALAFDGQYKKLVDEHSDYLVESAYNQREYLIANLEVAYSYLKTKVPKAAMIFLEKLYEKRESADQLNIFSRLTPQQITGYYYGWLKDALRHEFIMFEEIISMLEKQNEPEILTWYKEAFRKKKEYALSKGFIKEEEL